MIFQPDKDITGLTCWRLKSGWQVNVRRNSVKGWAVYYGLELDATIALALSGATKQYELPMKGLFE